MTPTPEEARQRLQAERKRLAQLKRSVETDILDEENIQNTELSSLDQHPGEAGTEVHDLERDHSIHASIETELRDVDEALARLDAGTYGRCEVDGAPIDDERLAAQPTARRCAAHQAELERA
jgi:RNA polymerase-binding transcription factor DksA